VTSAGSVTRRPVLRIRGSASGTVDDAVAVERALELRVGGRTLAVTLRTPGDDRELALGFLAGEGVIAAAADAQDVRLGIAACEDEPDLAEVTLRPGLGVDWARLERHFTATSACGLCGRAHLDALRSGLARLEDDARYPAQALLALPARVRGGQEAFRETGGLHAAVWCDAALEPRVLREDVGRHNAVDKVAGWLLERHGRPAPGGLLWVSGRAGAELVLKAARAGVPALAAVGAPTSLAIALAETARMTLIGFLREDRMNVYAGAHRLA